MSYAISHTIVQDTTSYVSIQYRIITYDIVYYDVVRYDTISYADVRCRINIRYMTPETVSNMTVRWGLPVERVESIYNIVYKHTISYIYYTSIIMSYTILYGPILRQGPFRIWAKPGRLQQMNVNILPSTTSSAHSLQKIKGMKISV